jgi:C4-dicarboxylate-specific signal transduction histidine kinase
MDRVTYEELQRQLDEAREVIRALRQGEVDAIISERDLALVRLRATEEALRRLTQELEARVRDRTAQLQLANERLEVAMAELRATQVRVLESERVTALAALAGAVAHEVHSPLMGVWNAVGYVRKHETRPELAQALKDADEGLRMVSDITRDLLTFAHTPSHFRAEADVSRVIDRAVNFLQSDLESRGITVVREVQSQLPLLLGDEVRLQQVLSNLLVNARDALDESPEKKIVVRAGVVGEVMRIEVADTGPGVPQQMHDRIFEPFFTTKAGHGTGLGLPVSRGIVEDLGGRLTLEETPGRGATFRVQLPLAAGQAPRSGK